MATFKDLNNNNWEIKITIGDLKRVKSITGHDLLAAENDDEVPLVVSLHDDSMLLADVVFALVKPQLDAKEINEEAFGLSLGGEAMANAYNALVEELSNFFHQRGDLALEKTLQKIKFTIKKALEAMEKKIDGISNEAIEAEVEKIFGEGSQKSPESAE